MDAAITSQNSPPSAGQSLEGMEGELQTALATLTILAELAPVCVRPEGKVMQLGTQSEQQTGRWEGRTMRTRERRAGSSKDALGDWIAFYSSLIAKSWKDDTVSALSTRGATLVKPGFALRVASVTELPWFSRHSSKHTNPLQHCCGNNVTRGWLAMLS